MATPNNQFSIDATQGTNALQSIVDEFKKYNAEIDRVTEAHAQMDTSGKVLEATLTSITKSGTSVIATLRDIGKGLEVVTAQAGLAGKALDSVTAARLAKKAQGREAASQQVQPKIEAAFGPLPGKATPADINAIKNATRDLIEAVKNGSIPAKTFFDTLKSVAAGTKQIFTGTAGDVQQLLDRIQAAYNRAGNATQRYNDKQKAQADKQGALNLGKKFAPFGADLIRKSFDFSALDDRGLERVQAKITQIVNALERGKLTIKEFGAGFQQFKTGDIGNLSGGAEKVRSTLASIRDIINGGSGGGGGIDFADFSRRASAAFHFVEAQILYNSISRLVDIFHQAAEEAAEFQRGIALIQTISDDAGLSFDQWAQGIRRVSDEFGKPIAEVAAANYDLLSNQVGKAADSFDTLREAASFARITNSSVKDSVDLMSSAINAFKLTSGDADRITKVFFTTIDLGRIKAQELANTFGRVASVSHSLGLSLEEASAALTTITRQGIQADTAQTLLLNTLQKMLNPTEKLQAEYDKLGVGTGEAFFKIYGLIGGLEKLNEITGGSTAKLAELQNELRGFQGTNILTKNLDELKKDLQAIQNPGNKIDLAKQVTTQTFGQVFKDELNKIRNYFITGFQTSILEGVLKITNQFGGLSTVVGGVFKSLTDAAILFVGAMSIGKVLQFAAGLNFSAISAGGFTVAMKSATQAALAFAAANPYLIIGAGIAVLIKGAIDAKIAFEGLRAAAKQAAEALQGGYRTNLDKQITTQRNNFIKATQDQQAELLKGTSKLRVELNKVAEIQGDIAKGVAEGVRNSFDVLTSQIKKVIGDIEKESGRARSSVQSLTDKLNDIQQTRSSEIFERRLATNQRNIENARTVAQANNRNPDEAANQIDQTGRIFADRIKQLQETAKVALAKYKVSVGEQADKAVAQTLAAYDEINKLRDRQAQIEKPVRVGNGFNFVELKARQFNNEDNITRSYREEVRIVQELRALEKGRAQDAEKEALDRRRDLEAYETAVSKVTKFDPFNGEGKLKAVYKDNPQNAINELKKFQEEAFNLAKKFTSPLERAGLGTTFNKQLTDVRTNLDKQFATEKQTVAIKELQKQTDELRDHIIEGTTDALKGFDKFKEKIDASKESIVKLNTEVETLILQLAGFQDQKVEGTLGSFLQRIGAKGPAGSSDALNKVAVSAGKKDFKQAIADLDAYQKKLNETYVQQGSVGVKGGEVIAEPESATRPAQTANQLINTTRLFLEKLSQKQQNYNLDLSKMDETIKEIGSSAPRVEELQKAIGNLGGAFQIPSQASEDAKNKILGNLDSIEARIKNVLEGLKAINNEKAKALKPTATAPTVKTGSLFNQEEEGTQYVQMGGRIKYYATGGPVGRDSQLAYFDPEEFVMNRYSARKFYSQLVQMNRGQTPKFGSDGASHQIHIGEINVTESKGGQQTAQQVVAAINRGVRTGTLRIK